jgi:hypothetical protein
VEFASPYVEIANGAILTCACGFCPAFGSAHIHADVEYASPLHEIANGVSFGGIKNEFKKGEVKIE